ncbi:MAG TPA: hypothetical protein VJT67_14005 [Longimicrobiaceae bacterium]|nr:hypothetical protein [Longimicrobiaceae bacterium]
MPTISAYTSDELKEKIDRVMREEGRKQAQVGSTALELYATLPAAARRAYIELSAVDDDVHAAALERAITEVSRALLNAKWDLLDTRVAEEVRARGLLPDGDLSEEEIGRIAVEITDRAGEA